MSSQDKPGVGKNKGARAAEAVDLANLEERRAAMRRPTFKAGEIILEDGGVVDCVVRNVSESGCLLKIENAAILSSFVEIRIDLDKPARPAQIIWRSMTLAGASFLRKPS